MLKWQAKATQLSMTEPDVELWLPYPFFDAGTVLSYVNESVSPRGHKVTGAAGIGTRFLP